jgi:hypothetical protein
MDIIELHHQLQENMKQQQQQNSNDDNSSSNSSKYKLRTAAVIKREKDASELLDLGVSPNEVSDLLKISPSEVARIEKEDEDKRRFLATGRLPESGVFTITLL